MKWNSVVFKRRLLGSITYIIAALSFEEACFQILSIYDILVRLFMWGTSSY